MASFNERRHDDCLWQSIKSMKGECAVMKEAYKQKQVIIDEIKDKFERAASVVVIDYIGITVAEADEMRKSFVKPMWTILFTRILW